MLHGWRQFYSRSSYELCIVVMTTSRIQTDLIIPYIDCQRDSRHIPTEILHATWKIRNCFFQSFCIDLLNVFTSLIIALSYIVKLYHYTHWSITGFFTRLVHCHICWYLLRCLTRQYPGITGLVLIAWEVRANRDYNWFPVATKNKKYG